MNDEREWYTLAHGAATRELARCKGPVSSVRLHRRGWDAKRGCMEVEVTLWWVDAEGVGVESFCLNYPRGALAADVGTVAGRGTGGVARLRGPTRGS